MPPFIQFGGFKRKSMETPNRFKEVDSINGYSVGDIIHIKRYYYEEGSLESRSRDAMMSNPVMVDVKTDITKITIDEVTDRDILWCGKWSTSSTDIANKGIFLTKDQSND